jgi:peptide/nickel transport system permease protein
VSEAGAAATEVEIPAPARRHRPWRVLVAGAWRQGRTKVGVVILLFLVGIALVGPYFAPYSPTEFVAPPFSSPSPPDVWFGADNLGRDVLSRFLWGGRSVLALSVAATVMGLVLGTPIGLIAAYSRGALDDVLMRAMDVILSFPQIVFALVLAATIGPKLWLLVLAVGITTTPRVARIARGTAVEVVERDFIRAAEAIGESRRKILLGDVLPNITGPLVVEASLRLSFNIAVVASLSFLGFGIQPPSADWGLMINENRNGLTLEPWPVVLPVVAIGLLTVATSLVGDGLSRALIGIERGGRGKE